MPDTKHVLHYKYRADWFFRIAVLILIALTIGMAVVAGSDVFQLSTFINHPQDFPLPLNDWAIDCEGYDERAKLSKTYLVLDFFFPLFLSFVVVILLKGATLASSEASEDFRVFDFFSFTELNLAGKVAIGFLVPAILFDWYENYLVYIALVEQSTGAFQPDWYASISTVKMALYLIPIALMLGSFLYTYWLDFARIWKKYIFYFYPSLIGVLFTFIIFGFFGQAFDFIVELTDPINLLFFLLLFLFALIGLWMVPYYLFFTDVINGYKDLSFGQILKYTITPYVRRGDTDATKDLKATAYKRRWQHIPFSDEGLFHIIRRSIAIVFILLFLLLQMNLLVEMTGISASTTAAVLVANLLAIIGLSYLFRTARLYDLNKIMEGDSSDIISGDTLNKGSKIFKRGSWLFAIVAFNAVITTIHISYSFWANSLEVSPDGSPHLMYQLILFCVHTFLFSLSFLIYAMYRKFKFEEKNFKWRVSITIYKFITRVSYTPNLISAYFLFSLLTFVMIALIMASHSPALEKINPLNLFLIILNFFVALIAFLDRLIKASLKSKKITFGPRSAGVLLATVIILFLASQLRENHYHDLRIIQVPKSAENKYQDLEQYTQQYLDTHPDSVVYFIASDGGGLKAAYWTMNVLHELNAKDTSFFNQVFLTSGASGGMVGLGMYTYLHAQKLKSDERRKIIDGIGSTNFLNNDLAGLAIKSPLVKIVPFFANIATDRTAAMAHRYFQLASTTRSFFDSIQAMPYAYLWQRQNYSNLPLLIVNTTKTEDGSRGVIHPLAYDANRRMLGSFTDLRNLDFTDDRSEPVSINLPDGLFTTNRFPLVSPFARVEGKGHFVDGGYLENSGLSTIYHFLNYMYLESDTTTVFEQFFKEKEIVVISIGNDQSSFIRNAIGNPKVNRSGSTGAISAILGAVSGGGLNALPQYYDHLFERLENPKNINSSRLSFYKIDMPFPFTVNDINDVFQGQVVDCNLGSLVESRRTEILGKIRRNPCSVCAKTDKYYLTPPLGRFMSQPSKNYMDDMIEHPEVKAAISGILAHRRLNGNELVPGSWVPIN